LDFVFNLVEQKESFVRSLWHRCPSKNNSLSSAILINAATRSFLSDWFVSSSQLHNYK
jgi:hypothetical protein